METFHPFLVVKLEHVILLLIGSRFGVDDCDLKVICSMLSFCFDHKYEILPNVYCLYTKFLSIILCISSSDHLIRVQCHNGHTLCSTCKTRVHNRCPTCRQELGDIRCLALEKVAESLELPCKYYSLGCPEIFPYYSKLKHEAVCNYRPYTCPYAGSECSVVGDIPFLVSHLRDDHKVDMHTGCTFNHRYVKSNPREVENATWMLTVSAIYTL